MTMSVTNELKQVLKHVPKRIMADHTDLMMITIMQKTLSVLTRCYYSGSDKKIRKPERYKKIWSPYTTYNTTVTISSSLL